MVEVEFYGVARKHAGVASARVEFQMGAVLGDILVDLAKRFPNLEDNCIRDGKLAIGFIANVDGDQFISDPAATISDGSSLLIMSSDAGG